MNPIVNPSAPDYNPDYWNDFSWLGLSFFLAEHHPETVKALKEQEIKLTPNNIGNILKHYSDIEIAIALNVEETEAQEFRETVLTLMQARQLNTNCFCHAVNDSGPFPPFMKPWPGMLQGLKPSDGKYYTPDKIIEVTEASGALPIGTQPKARDGFYNIVLLLRKDGKELHYARENGNGEYSHKTALGPVTNLDESGRIITDPLRADWGDYNLAQVFHITQNGLTVGIPLEERADRPKELDDLFASLSL